MHLSRTDSFSRNGMIDKCTISLNAPENHIGRIDAMEGIIIDPKNQKHGQRDRFIKNVMVAIECLTV